MDISTQIGLLNCIKEDFDVMRNMLTKIEANITEHSVTAQLAFIKPLKNIICEALIDSLNSEDSFLTNDEFNDNTTA